jgi:hypothetical protein
LLPLLPFSFETLTISRASIRSVDLVQQGWFRSSVGSWRLNVEHGEGSEGFVFAGRERQQLDQATAFFRAIKQWQNQS